jgi:hypothetical protein
MATTTEALDRFAVETGIKLVTLDRVTRVLRNASMLDVWPKSGKGGGKSAAHVQAHHLANLILSLPATQPSDALEMVCLLRMLLSNKAVLLDKKTISFGLDFSAVDPEGETVCFEAKHYSTGEPEIPRSSLGTTLQNIITELANNIIDEKNVVASQGWGIVLSLSEPAAYICPTFIDNEMVHMKWTLENASTKNSPERELREAPRSRPKQIYMIPPSLIFSAAELLADTLRHTQNALIEQGSKTKAPASLQEEPAPLDQPGNTKIGPRNTPHRSGE